MPRVVKLLSHRWGSLFLILGYRVRCSKFLTQGTRKSRVPNFNNESLGSIMQMSRRKLNSRTILQLWCCCHVMYKLLYPSIRVRTAPSVSVRVRVRVSVSFSFGVTQLRILICMCPLFIQTSY